MSEAIVQEQDARIYYNTLKRVGLQGNYQNNLVRVIFLLTVLSASTFFVVPFLFYQDGYVCPEFQGDCNAMVCALPEAKRKDYLPSPLIKSLGNYYGDMHCETMGKVTQFQEMFLIGTSFGLFVSLLFIQFIGRKTLVSLSLILISISLVIVLFAQASIAKSVGLFIWGTGSEISFSILTAFITEKTAEKDRLGHYYWLQFWFTVGCLANCVVFFLFRDWKLVIGCYFLPFYIAITLAFIFYVESPPLELIARESPEAAFAAFMRIAERNGVIDHGLTLEEVTSLQEEYRQNQKRKHNYTLNFFDLFKYGSVRGDFLKLSLMMFIFFFLLYGPSFVLDQLNMNIFVLTLINVASQFITFPAFAYFIEMPRRVTQIRIYIAATVFSYLIFAFAPDDCFKCNQGWKLVFTLLFFFISRIFINLAGEVLQSSLNQTFPAQIRSLGIYGVIAMARLSSIIIPYLTKLKQASGVPLLLQFAIMTFLAVISAYLIRETFQILPPQLIEELRFEHKVEDDQQ